LFVVRRFALISLFQGRPYAKSQVFQRIQIQLFLLHPVKYKVKEVDETWDIEHTLENYNMYNKLKIIPLHYLPKDRPRKQVR